MSKNATKDENTQYNDHWLEKIVNKISERDHDTINLSTGKTPSGHIHMGIMRELLICDGLRRKFEKQGKKVNYRLFFDSLDAAKRFPSYIPKVFEEKYLGYPFALMPNPLKSTDDELVEKTEKSYAQTFGKELIECFETLGIKVKPIWTDDLYKTDEMKEMIRIGLKKNEQVKEIVAKYITASMTDEKKARYLKQQESWMGAMVICENCNRTQKKLADGSIKPNRVLSYDEKNDKVHYKCPACNHEGDVSIESGLVKLNWRLDWPAKWTIFNTTCEPAGKDHCTPGGSYDTGLDLCQNIYGYKGPVKVAYEWLRLGDRDMKTSKGIVFTPDKFLEMAEPEILRMLIFKTDPNKHISIRVEEMENYYNDFQKMEEIYFGKEEAGSEEELREIKYMYPLICTEDVPEKMPSRLPFKLRLVLVQLIPLLGKDKVYEKAKEYFQREDLAVVPKKTLLNRLEKVENWLDEIKAMLKTEKDPKLIKTIKYKVPMFSFIDEIPKEIKENLTDLQKQAFEIFIEKSESIDAYTNEMIKEMMMDIREEIEIKPRDFFQAFYFVFLGKKRGPRLGPLMEMMDKEWIIERLKSAL